jgi:hypothetical protein
MKEGGQIHPPLTPSGAVQIDVPIGVVMLRAFQSQFQLKLLESALAEGKMKVREFAEWLRVSTEKT